MNLKKFNSSHTLHTARKAVIKSFSFLQNESRQLIESSQSSNLKVAKHMMFIKPIPLKLISFFKKRAIWFIKVLKMNQLSSKISEAALTLTRKISIETMTDLKFLYQSWRLKKEAKAKLQEMLKQINNLRKLVLKKEVLRLMRSCLFIRKIEKNLLLIQRLKQKSIIRLWIAFIRTKNMTKNKYKDLYPEMWNVYSKKAFGKSGFKKCCNQQQLFDELFGRSSEQESMVSNYKKLVTDIGKCNASVLLNKFEGFLLRKSEVDLPQLEVDQ